MANRAVDEPVPVQGDSHGKRRLSFVSLVVAMVVALAGLAGAILVLVAAPLPTPLMIAAVAADLVVTALVVALLLSSGPRRHKVRFAVAVILSVLLVGGNGAITKAGADWLGFTHTITTPPTPTVLYDIVVRADGPQAVSELKGSLMGEVAGDSLSAQVHSKIGELTQVTLVPSSPWTDTIAALINQDVTSIVIDDGSMQILSGADPAKYAQLRILTNFEVEGTRTVTPPKKPTPTPTPTPKAPNGAYILYISGIDTDGSISNQSRSDVNILLVANPTTGQILLVNTPRDFYVQLRGTDGLKDKLTHAGVYGISESIGTLEDLYGVTIDYYLRINFTSLVKVVDTLGGVDVESAYAFSAGGYTFHIGTNHLNGEAALAFSRDRHDFAGGDRVRGQNQQRVITGIIKKLSDPAVLANYSGILAALQTTLQTSMPADVMTTQIKRQLATNTAWNVTSISVDGTGAMDYTYSYPGQQLYVMVPDQATVDAAKAQITQTLNG